MPGVKVSASEAQQEGPQEYLVRVSALPIPGRESVDVAAAVAEAKAAIAKRKYRCGWCKGDPVAFCLICGAGTDGRPLDSAGPVVVVDKGAP